MSDESPSGEIHETVQKRSRRGIASYLRRIARRLGRGEPVPVDEEQTVTVEVPAEPDLEVELEQEGDEISLEIEMEWEGDGEAVVDTEAEASKATFELYEDNAEEWRWRLVHDNGNIIADSGEGYDRIAGARNGLDSVVENAPGAHVVDQSNDEEAPDEGGSSATFELFEDSAEEWRWRLVHDNGEIIGDGSQGYASKQKCKQGLRSVKGNVRGAPVEELD